MAYKINVRFMHFNSIVLHTKYASNMAVRSYTQFSDDGWIRVLERFICERRTRTCTSPAGNVRSGALQA